MLSGPSSHPSSGTKDIHAVMGHGVARSTVSRTSRKHQPPLHLPLPWGKGEPKGMYYYGYAIDEAWLLEFAHKCGSKYKDITVDDAMFGILSALRDRTNIRSLYYEHGIVDPTKPTPFAPSRVHEGNIPDVLIFAICSTKRLSYNNRPSRAQVDHFERLTGLHDKRWWKDAAPLYPKRQVILD